MIADRRAAKEQLAREQVMTPDFRNIAYGR
jgi:hypothetical protein